MLTPTPGSTTSPAGTAALSITVGRATAKLVESGTEPGHDQHSVIQLVSGIVVGHVLHVLDGQRPVLADQTSGIVMASIVPSSFMRHPGRSY